MAAPEPDPLTLSRDSTWSTVSPDPDVEEQYPPAGPQSIETLGVPGGASQSKSKSTTSSSSAKAS